jgi:Na+-translocating ferredoxin:NAD+ oxidoreductase RnfC subunit
MPATVAPEVLEAMQARLQSAGLAGGDGLKIELRPAPLVVGRVCDDHPLLCSEAALARQAPERLLRGLAAAGLLCGAGQVALAVDEEQPEALRALERAASGSRVELWPIAARVPLDAQSLLFDLAPRGLDPRRALVLDAVALSDLGQIVEDRPLPYRVVTVAGLVRRPAVLLAVPGAPLGELVRAAGGSLDPAAVLLHLGAASDEPASPEQPVELHTRGLLVLPHHHPLVLRRTVPVEDELRRAASACAACRVCSDTCTANLLGAPLEPHRVLLAAAASSRWDHDPGVDLLGALECRGCALCSAACPSGLQPARVVAAVAGRLREQGVRLAAPAPVRPHPDRAGRRLSRQRLAERLGLSTFPQPDALSGAVVLPAQLRVAARGPGGAPRVPVVRTGETVRAGDLLALAAAGSRELDCRAAAAGHVVSVDPDDGILVALR